MSVKERWNKAKPLAFSTDDAITRILPLLQSDARVSAAYLFGSRAAGSEARLSDIDIAVFTSGNFVWDDYYTLYGDLTRNLHSDRVDMVWLNKAEPVLGFEIIKTGKLLFFRNADILNESELTAKRKYYDYVLYLNKHRRHRDIGL